MLHVSRATSWQKATQLYYKDQRSRCERGSIESADLNQQSFQCSGHCCRTDAPGYCAGYSQDRAFAKNLRNDVAALCTKRDPHTKLGCSLCD
jgi:hypothetical protein